MPQGGRGGRRPPPRGAGGASTVTTRRSERKRGSFRGRNVRPPWAAEQSSRRHRHPHRRPGHHPPSHQLSVSGDAEAARVTAPRAPAVSRQRGGWWGNDG
jgi:hypothetical protein